MRSDFALFSLQIGRVFGLHSNDVICAFGKSLVKVKDSLQSYAPSSIMFLKSRGFTFSRYLVPELNKYEGWALFCDCDLLFLEDVNNLFELADDKYAVMCVQHDYTPKEGTKMDGKQQTIYPRKNWSSVVLWNCSHQSNKQVNKDLVNNPDTTGKYLHRFSWLKDEEIGSIPHDWNWLVGWYKEPEDGTPSAIHYTEGGPWFENYRFCDYHQIWKDTLNQMMNSKD